MLGPNDQALPRGGHGGKVLLGAKNVFKKCMVVCKGMLMGYDSPVYNRVYNGVYNGASGAMCLFREGCEATNLPSNSASAEGTAKGGIACRDGMVPWDDSNPCRND